MDEEGDNKNNNKIRHKESSYRKLYSSLLQRKKVELQQHLSVTSSSSDGTKSSVFEEEQQVLGNIVKTETTNLFCGVATTFTIFAGLRFGSRHVIQRLGGAKATQFQQADQDARRLGTTGIQQRIGMYVTLWYYYCIYFAADDSYLKIPDDLLTRVKKLSLQ